MRSAVRHFVALGLLRATRGTAGQSRSARAGSARCGGPGGPIGGPRSAPRRRWSPSRSSRPRREAKTGSTGTVDATIEMPDDPDVGADPVLMGQTGVEFTRGVWPEPRPRVGARHPASVVVRWSDARPGRSSRHRWRRVRPCDAVASDLSVTGARLLLPAGAVLAVGSRLNLDIGGSTSMASVVWVEAALSDRARLCGVMFVAPDDRFLATISTIIEDHGRSSGGGGGGAGRR